MHYLVSKIKNHWNHFYEEESMRKEASVTVNISRRTVADSPWCSVKLLITSSNHFLTRLHKLYLELLFNKESKKLSPWVLTLEFITVYCTLKCFSFKQKDFIPLFSKSTAFLCMCLILLHSTEYHYVYFKDSWILFHSWTLHSQNSSKLRFKLILCILKKTLLSFKFKRFNSGGH